MFKMLKQKTLKRLTRLGLCMYATIYCMAFTAYAGELPAQEEYIPEEAVFEEVTESLAETPVSEEETVEAAEAAVDAASETTAEEPAQEPEAAEALDTAYVDPGETFTTQFNYTGATITGLAVEIGKKLNKENPDISTKVTLLNDIYLDDGEVQDWINVFGRATIEGNGHIMDGRQGLSSSKVPLEKWRNLAMFEYYKDLTFKNVVFTNFADSVIYNNLVDTYAGQSLKFINCTFKDNRGTFGGMAYINHTGCSLSFTNCTFVNNEASKDGGAICWNCTSSTGYGRLSLQNCEFINNKADREGGAIFLDNGKYDLKDNSLYNCSFLYNSAGDSGGAIYAGSQAWIESKECVYEGNSAGMYGGVIAIMAKTSMLWSRNDRYESNTASEGGAIYDNIDTYNSTTSNYQNYLISYCTFLNNEAEYGGALFRNKFVTDAEYIDSIGNSIFLHNDEPVIYLGTVTGKDSFSREKGTFWENWFGDVVDNNPWKKPSLGGDVDGLGNYNWLVMNVEWWTGFKTYIASRRYNNGSADYSNNGYDRAYLPSIELYCDAIDATLSNSTITLKERTGYSSWYGDSVDIESFAPEKKYFNITISDPYGGVLLNRRYSRGFLDISVDTFGNETTYPKNVWDDCYIGDIITLRAGTSHDITGPDGTPGTSLTSGPRAVNTPVSVVVNGVNIGNYTTNSTGFFNITTDDLIPSGGYLKFNITSPLYDYRDQFSECSVRISEKGYTSADCILQVKNLTYGSDKVALESGVYSPTGIDRGVLSLYYNSTAGNEKLLEKWDLETLPKVYNKSAPYSFFSDGFMAKVTLDKFDVGNYSFRTEYICKDGKYKNTTAKSKVLQILPRESGIAWGKDRVFVFDGKSHAPAASATDVINGDKVGVAVEGAGVNAGNYTAKAIGFNGEKGKNYLLSVSPNELRLVDFEIKKAAGLNSTATGYAKLDGDKTLFTKNISSLMPENAGSVSYTALTAEKIKGSGQVANFTAENGVVNALIKGAANGDEYKLPVKADSANYNSSIINIIVTVTDGETPAPTPGGENKTEQVVYKNETLPIPADLNVTMKVTYPENIVYGRTKVTVKEIAPGVYQFANRTIKVDSSLLNISTVVFKAYNTKKVNVAGAKKQPYLTMKLKARKGVKLSKQEKKLIKQVNKALKKVKIYFDIVPEDLKNLTDVVVKLNKKHTKVTKVTAKLGGKKIKLTKKEYSVDEINDTEKYVQITGATNFKGTIRIPIK